MTDLSAGQDDLKRALEESRTSLAQLDAAVTLQGQSPDEAALTVLNQLRADIAMIEGILKADQEQAEEEGHGANIVEAERSEDIGGAASRVRKHGEEAGQGDRARAKDGINPLGQKRKIKEIITPGGYKIPEHLQIKPTDSQHQKQLKRKKIALLKKQQRQDSANQEARQRASAWQKHFTKGPGGPKSRSRTMPSSSSSALPPSASAAASSSYGTSKGSIFSTSDLPDGKVGVTNSGRGMTSFRTRQKHVYPMFDDEGGDNEAGDGDDDDDDDDNDDASGGEDESAVTATET